MNTPAAGSPPPPLPGIDALLLDVEGTVAPIDFVKGRMFAVATAELPDFLRARRAEPPIRARLDEVRETARLERGADLDDEGAIRELLDWIAADRKHPALKDLQGRVWRDAFVRGLLVPPFYPDVAPTLRTFRAAGHRVAVYSSGSIEAQQLFYRYADAGDLTSLVDAWFDLGTGSKQDPGSYARIAGALAVAPDRLLFLTDAWSEVLAARAAGLPTLAVARPGNAPLPTEAAPIRSFSEIRSRLAPPPT